MLRIAIHNWVACRHLANFLKKYRGAEEQVVFIFPIVMKSFFYHYDNEIFFTIQKERERDRDRATLAPLHLHCNPHHTISITTQPELTSYTCHLSPPPTTQSPPITQPPLLSSMATPQPPSTETPPLPRLPPSTTYSTALGGVFSGLRDSNFKDPKLKAPCLSCF